MTTGKTKIKPNDIFGGLFSGDFFKKKSIISEEDIQALENYNKLLADNAPAEAFKQSMSGASKTAQNLAKSAKGAAVDIGTIPKVSKAATLGIKALSLVMNIGATFAITALISGITKMIGASEEMSQQASEATSNYKEQTASIDEYKNKITELKTALNDENISYSDARDKRSQLLDIQKQLIDTYGAEASGINLVNGSLDDQIEKLDTLNKQKRQEWENEVNKQTTGQWWQKWGGYLGLALLDTVTLDWSFYDANKWLEDFDNTTNIERITKKVENFKKSINLNDLDLDSEELEKLKSQLDSFNGVSFKGNKMTIAGDAKTVQDTITQIQTQVIGSREDLRSLDQDLKDVYNSAKKIVDANWDTYNTALQNQILDDKTGLEYYGKLTEAYETYQEAVKDGDENTINEAKENYAKILSDIDGSNMSDSFKKFFENMYPDISDIVDDWKFEVEIVPKINANRGENELNNAIKSVKDLTTEEISAAFENNGTGVTKDQWKAITDLNAEAQANGLDLTTFLEQLREAGYLVSQLDKDIEKAVNDTKNKYGDGVDWGKYFKDNSIDTQEEIDKWNEVTNGIDNAEDAMNAYAEATKNANEMTVSMSKYAEAVDSLKHLQSAMDDIADSGSISIDTLAEIEEAFSGVKGVEDYVKTLSTAKKGSAEFNEAMRGLTYGFIEQFFTTEELANADEKLIAKMLESVGAANDAAVAHDMVSQAKERVRIETELAKDSSYAGISALMDEGSQCGLTKIAFEDLVLSIGVFNNTQLDVAGKIAALQELGYFAQLTSSALAAVKDGGSVKYFNIDGKRAMGAYNKDGKMVGVEFLEDMPQYSSNTTPQYNSSNKSGSSKESNKALDDYLNKLEEARAINKKGLLSVDELGDSYKDLTKYIDDLQYAYDNLAKTEAERAEIQEKMAQAREDYVAGEMSAIDDIQSAYDVVTKAMEEQKEYGDISVDTLQSLLELEPQYINMLIDENGNLVLNEEAIQNCTAAYIDQLGVKAAFNLIDSVTQLQSEAEQLELLADQARATTADLWGLVYAQLAVAQSSVSAEVGALLSKQIEGIQKMTESAKAGLSNGGLNSFANTRSASEKAEDAEKAAEQARKAHLEQLKEDLEKRKDLIERYSREIEVLDFGLDIIEEDDFANKTDILTDKLGQLKEYGMAMREEFERVANIVPQTGDEAEELANRLEELGSNMRDNITVIRETQVALQQLSIDMISTVADTHLGQLESTLNRLDRRIEILNSDYKDDYKYTNEILSTSALLPIYSDFDKQRREKQRSDAKLIDIEQETQDTINEIITKSLEMQSKENEEAREKERKNLIGDMESTRQAVSKKLDQAYSDYQGFTGDVVNETDSMVADVSTAINEMDLSIPEIDTSKAIESLENLSAEADSILKNLNKKFDDVDSQFNAMNSWSSVRSGVYDTQQTPSGSGSNSNAVISTANEYLGTPYVFRGTSLTNGIDCSSFTQQVVGQNGGSLPRSAAAQWDATARVSKDDLQPGDLVFFKDTYKDGISHVGIYQGDGKFIHASSSKGVTISDLNSSYYKEHWAGGGRYATGTPSGNAKAGSLGIAGENYKPEILIDKATGEMEYIDSPTVIDTDKTDVVGEKQTAQLPKYASGTFFIETLDEFQAIVDSLPDSNSYPASIPVIEESLELTKEDIDYPTVIRNFKTGNNVTDYELEKVQEGGNVNVFLRPEIDTQLLEEKGWGVGNLEYDSLFTKTISNTSFEDLDPGYNYGDRVAINFTPIIADPETGEFIGVLTKDELYDYAHDVLAGVRTDDLNLQIGAKFTGASSGSDASEAIAKLNYWYDEIREDIINAEIQTTRRPQTAQEAYLHDAAWTVGFGNHVIDFKTPIYNAILATLMQELNGQDLSYDTWNQLMDKLPHNIYSDFMSAYNDVTTTHTPSMPPIAVKVLSEDSKHDNEIVSYEEYTKNAIIETVALTQGIYGTEAETIAQEQYSNAPGFNYTSTTDGGINNNDESLPTNNNSSNNSSSKVLTFEEQTMAEIDAFYDRAVAEIGQANRDAILRETEILNDPTLTNFEKSQKLYENSYALGQEAAGLGKAVYDELYAYYTDWMEKTQSGAIEWSSEVFEYFSEILTDLEEVTYNLENIAVETKQKQADQRWDNSNNWISDRNFYSDWRKFNDSESKAWSRVIDWLEAEFPNELDKLKEARQNYYQTSKDEAVGSIEFASSKIGSLKTIAQSYYDTINSIVQSQNEINKELKASQTMYEWLDEETRKLLFNQEDYNILSNELLSIQERAVKLQEDFNKEVTGTSQEELAEITAEYQMQYETLMKSYEIAKADLEVVKKRKQLDNVLAERNVRMFINGQWQWVANTQDVINAQNELADAQFASSRAQTSKIQTEHINELTKAENVFTTIINKINSGLIDMDTPISEVTEAFDELNTTFFPAFKNILTQVSNGLKVFAFDEDDMIVSEPTELTLPTNAYTPFEGQTNYVLGGGNSAGEYLKSGIELDMVSATSENEVVQSNETRNKNIQDGVFKGEQLANWEAVALWQSGNLAHTLGIEKQNTENLIPIAYPEPLKDLESLLTSGSLLVGLMPTSLADSWKLLSDNKEPLVQSIDNSVTINGFTYEETPDTKTFSEGLRRITANHC